MPCLYCVIKCGLKLFGPLPDPILTCSRKGQRLSLNSETPIYKQMPS
jgi:hypothetical protein